MSPVANGYFETFVPNCAPGALYRYIIDGQKEYPDPASRFQPEGVHGPSMVVSHEFDWSDGGWKGIPLDKYVIYELHVGTFTPEGTFESAVDHLDYLTDLGVTAIELMPVAQFPGARNWGYDGVYPFSPQNSYGGPRGLKTLVDACHARGLAAVLDVVYNHLGPEGNYLSNFGPYFTDAHKTPWGSAMNFEGACSDEVRRFFIENALYWITEFHFDALRLDAVHAIFDQSAYRFLEQLADEVLTTASKLGRTVYVIGESNLNDSRLVTPRACGGTGLSAQWNDDFHHALHTLLTPERDGYYADFNGLPDLAVALADGYVYSGQYSVFRQCRHGNSSQAVPAERLVVFAQNHDQIGNRMMGERLSSLVSVDHAKLAAAAVLLSPYIPLLFMGEEYGERAPFLYFVSHADPDLVSAVRKGRAEEFTAFSWKGEPPDPQSEDTFLRSKLDASLQAVQPHAELLAFYKELLELRKRVPALATLDKKQMHVTLLEPERVLAVRRSAGPSHALALFCFAEKATSIELPAPAGTWHKILDSTQSPNNLEIVSDSLIRLEVNSTSVVVFLKA